MRPNKVFLTKYDNETDAFRLYSGDMFDPYLVSDEAIPITTKDALLKILEAGPDSYEKRVEYYKENKQ